MAGRTHAEMFAHDPAADPRPACPGRYRLDPDATPPANRVDEIFGIDRPAYHRCDACGSLAARVRTGTARHVPES